jgi:hypothetical protein
MGHQYAKKEHNETQYKQNYSKDKRVIAQGHPNA